VALRLATSDAFALAGIPDELKRAALAAQKAALAAQKVGPVTLRPHKRFEFQDGELTKQLKEKWKEEERKPKLMDRIVLWIGLGIIAVFIGYKLTTFVKKKQPGP
jgi:hypothetical protein